MLRRTLVALGLTALLPGALAAQELNLYSARHYDTDRMLYDRFTKETGIPIRLIEGDADQLIERIRNEGANSPADVLITVDAARLQRAKDAGVLAPVQSEALAARIPANLRDPAGYWFGFSMRARVIMYDKEKGKPEGLARLEDLADPRFKGQICVRSSNHPYNISLVGSVLAADGPERTEAWLRGLVANFARPPQGGDTPQFTAIVAGQCGIAIANTYYLVRYIAASDPEKKAIGERIGVIFPNQGPGDRGAHVNISGAGVAAHAPHREAAVKFLEYLATPEAQAYFANGNYEYPVVEGVAMAPALASLGTFRADRLNAAVFAANSAQALQMMQRAGWR